MAENLYRSSSTNYETTGADLYATHRHGRDGDVFLDPTFLQYLSSDNLKGTTVIDIGCGAGPWSIYAAKNEAAHVVALDIQPGMVANAAKAFSELDTATRSRLSLLRADGYYLPVTGDLFDTALSINVGCNMPQLSPHLSEIERVLRNGGKAVITAPTTFDVVFTDGEYDQKTAKSQIQQVLDANTEHKPDSIPDGLKELTSVLRATLMYRDNRWMLVENESDLVDGEPILRKLPGLVVPNRYHHPDTYLKAAKQAGLKVETVHRPCFSSVAELEAHNTAHPDKVLGEEYVNNAPFTVFVLSK